jgi:hypothetical protein
MGYSENEFDTSKFARYTILVATPSIIHYMSFVALTCLQILSNLVDQSANLTCQQALALILMHQSLCNNNTITTKEESKAGKAFR